MTDETRPTDTGAEPGATATAPHAEGEPEHADAKDGHDPEHAHTLHQTVEIKDIGPCKKHIKVTIERGDIQHRLNDKYHELVKGHDAFIPGFRPGKAPRKLVERRYEKEVADQVKGEILLASLEQLAEEHDLAPLAPPNIDPFAIVIPKEGPLVYEFEVEVRPEFDMPSHKGLKLKRPVKEFTDEDVDKETRRLLAPHAQVVPKPEGSAREGDILIADVTVRDGDRVVNTLKEYRVRVDPRLAFKDGVAERFGEQVKGANAGDTRVVDITLSQSIADPNLRGKTVQASFAIQDVKALRMPELTHDFLHNFGVHSEDQLKELIRVVLRRRLEHVQRQSAREQVIQHLAFAKEWDLPVDLLQRQARRAISRRIMEMRADGIPEADIEGRVRMLQQDILRSTAISLKEHFVLQKVAEMEKIDVEEDDLDAEIDRLAEQNDESPRRLKARLEKEDMIDALAAELIERKSLDLILEHAEYEDVPLGQQESDGGDPVATVEEQTVPGELKDPTAPPPAEAKPEEAPAPQS